MPTINKPEEEILPLFNGKVTDITLPSTKKVKIRETNGNDDDILSSLNDSVDGSNLYNFLSSIVLSDSTINDKKPTAKDIEEWLINDKYGLLFKQRIFIHGYDLEFKASCTEEHCKHQDNYFQDLHEFEGILIDYPMGPARTIEFVISSGKKFKYSLLTGKLEKRALELKDSSKNSPLIVRELAVENKGAWVPVKHFGGFSSREMLEIRAHYKKNDQQFDPMVNFTCANPKCKKQYSQPLFTIGAFFYPEEMI